MTEYSFQIIQDGIEVAGGSGGDLDRMRSMMMHYAMVYSQDGPVQMTGSPELLDPLKKIARFSLTQKQP